MGVSSLTLQTIGCADDLIAIIKDLRDKKPISTVYIAQFGAQLFFLALSVKNFRLTEKLTEVSGSRNPKSIRKILRQHNSDGSLKYFFAGADFMEKNIQLGLTTPMMLRMIFENCLNVAEPVKNECEKAFDSRLTSIERLYSHMLSAACPKDYFKSLLTQLLKSLNFVSLDKLLKFAAKNHRKKNVGAFEEYLFLVYVAVYKQDEIGNINDFISSLTDDSFDILMDEIIIEYHLTGKDLPEGMETELEKCEINLGRKIYLVIQARCGEFVDKLKEFQNSKEEALELLYEGVENILKRLTLEAATVFFGLVKSILNECVLQLPMPDAFKIVFQKLVKKFNGNLTAIEKELKLYLQHDSRERNTFKKDAIDSILQSKKALELKRCSVCGGQGFI